MRPVCPTQGSTTGVATQNSFMARQRSGSFFGGHGLKAVQGRRRGAAAHFFFPLQKLLATPNLRDVFDSPVFGVAPRWTYGSGKQQLDYLLVSKPLFDRVLQVGIERRGMFSKTSFGGAVPHFPTVTNGTTHVSDHAAVWAEFGPL